MIYPSLGSFGSWPRVIGVDLSGSALDKCIKLLKYYECMSTLPADNWPIRPIVVRAMAFELMHYYCNSNDAPPDEFYYLMTSAMSLPKDFANDPVHIFQGITGAGAPEHRKQEQAMWIDRAHLIQHGKPMSENKLSKKMEVSRSTIRKWRADAGHQEFVSFLAPNEVEGGE